MVVVLLQSSLLLAPTYQINPPPLQKKNANITLQNRINVLFRNDYLHYVTPFNYLTSDVK